MPESPLVAARYPTQDDGPYGGEQIQAAVLDLEPYTVPRFGSAIDRDLAYGRFTQAGGVLELGALCTVEGIPYQYAGGLVGWRSVVGGVIGKMWRTAGATAVAQAGYTTIDMQAARVSGGVTFDDANNRLVLPIDGLYRLSHRYYLTGANSQTLFVLARVRAGVTDNIGLAAVMAAKVNPDQQDGLSEVYPLKAGDGIYQTCYGYGAGMQYFGNGEGAGNAVTVEWVAPLNGATAV